MKGVKFNAVSDGTYLLTETDNPDVFVFLREDEGPLGEYGSRPLELYQAFMTIKMQRGEIPAGILARNVFYEDIEGYNAIRLWTYELGKEPEYIRRIMNGNAEGGTLPN